MLKLFIALFMTLSCGLASADDSVRAELRTLLVQTGANQNVVEATMRRIGRESEFRPRSENLSYSSPESLRRVFGKTLAGFTDDELRARFVKSPKALGNFVYKSIGGYTYRGRGYIQLTGVANYRTYSRQLFGDDRLVRFPDLANRPDIARKIMVAYITTRVAKVAKDRWKLSLSELNPTQAAIAVRVGFAGRNIAPLRKAKKGVRK